MHSSKSLNKVTGFTLIELMIVVAIIAILASIAVPSYRQYVIRGNRSAAQSVMMDIANRQQQFLLANRRYADDATLAASGFSLPAEVAAKYTLSVAREDSPPGYTITMTPIATGTQAMDGALGLNSQGEKTPLDKWQR